MGVVDASRKARRRRAVSAQTARLSLAAALLAVVSSCSAPPGPTPTSGSSGADHPGGSSSASSSASGSTFPPLSARIDQFRDNYATHVIQIQVSNNGTDTVTVVAAAVQSGQFSSPIAWTASQDGTAIPPGQTKSLPAALPSAECSAQVTASGNPSTPGRSNPASGLPQGEPRLELRITGAPSAESLPIEDPFGVLTRNHDELCLSEDVAAIVRFEFAPGLTVRPGTGTGILTLKYLPQGRDGSVDIESFQGTTLISEDAGNPWPKGTVLDGRGPAGEIQLVIRPTRCDPHAVAEDKVGTLLPLTVSTGGRAGIIKIPADAALKGAIQDFVTTLCHGPQ